MNEEQFIQEIESNATNMWNDGYTEDEIQQWIDLQWSEWDKFNSSTPEVDEQPNEFETLQGTINEVAAERDAQVEQEPVEPIELPELDESTIRRFNLGKFNKDEKEQFELYQQNRDQYEQPQAEGALARGWETGKAQADAVDDGLIVLAQGGDISDENLDNYFEAVDVLSKTSDTKEMRAFTKSYQDAGGGFYGFTSALIKHPEVAVETSVASLRAMFNPASGGAALVGGAGGAALGSAFPIIGNIVGAATGASSTAGGILEAGLSVTELIQEELAKDGKEWTKENVRALLDDEEKFSSIRNRALARAGTIAGVDLITGGLVGRYVKGGKGLAKAARTVGASGISAVGEGVGESAARFVAGQEQDALEIGLETVGGLVTSTPETVGGLVEGAREQANLPVYKLNGEVVEKEVLQGVLKDATDEDLKVANIEVANDAEFSETVGKRYDNIDKKDAKTEKEVAKNVDELNKEYDQVAANTTREERKPIADAVANYVGKAQQEGNMSKEQAEKVLSNMDNTEKAINKIPSSFSQKKKEQALPLVKEKTALEEQIKDKDPILVHKEKARLESIDQELATIAGAPTEEKVEATPKKAAKPAEKVLTELEEGIQVKPKKNEGKRTKRVDGDIDTAPTKGAVEETTKTTLEAAKLPDDKSLDNLQQREINQEEANQIDFVQRAILRSIAPQIPTTKDTAKGTQATVGLSKDNYGKVVGAAAKINFNPNIPRQRLSTGEEYAHTYTTSKLISDALDLGITKHIDDKINPLLEEVKNTDVYKDLLKEVQDESKQYGEQSTAFMDDVNKMAEDIGSKKRITIEQARELTALNEAFAKETGKAFTKFVDNGYKTSGLSNKDRNFLQKLFDYIKKLFSDLGLTLKSDKEVYTAFESGALDLLTNPETYSNINQIGDAQTTQTEAGASLPQFTKKKEVEEYFGLSGREYEVARRAVVNRDYNKVAPKDKEGKLKLLNETAEQIQLSREATSPDVFNAENELGAIENILKSALADPSLKALKGLVKKNDIKKAAAKVSITLQDMDGQTAAGFENALISNVFEKLPDNLPFEEAKTEAQNRAQGAANIISSLTEHDLVTLRKEKKGQWYTHVLNGEFAKNAYLQGREFLQKEDTESRWSTYSLEPLPDWTNNKHETGLDAITGGSKKIPDKALGILNKAKNVPRGVNTNLLKIINKSMESPLLTYSDKLIPDGKRAIKSAPLFDTIRIANEIGDKTYYSLSKFDYRGRLNQMMINLNPQANKLGKALAYLKNKDEIGVDGWNQLLVQLSDTEGEFEGQTEAERVAYAESKLDEWLEMRDGTLTPFEGVDEPFLFVATLEEVKQALDSGDKFSFKSGLPIRKDATVSQGQQIAGFTKDRNIAEMLNLIPTEAGRRDLYSDIGKNILSKYEQPSEEQLAKMNEISKKLVELEKAMKDSSSKEEWIKAMEAKNAWVSENKEDVQLASKHYWASKWDKFRSVMKKPLMTYVYGAGDATIRAKILGDLAIEPAFIGINEQFVFYLYNDIRKEFSSELGAIIDYKRLLTKVANRAYKRWNEAPNEDKHKFEFLKFKGMYDGFPFHQRYLLPVKGTTTIKYKGSDPVTLKQLKGKDSASISFAVANRDLDSDRMESSIGANFTHFGDAQVVHYVIGENPFDVDTVHDDFAANPANTAALLKSLNQSMVDIYAGNPLRDNIEFALGKELADDALKNFKFGDVSSTEYSQAEFAFGAGKAPKFKLDIDKINEDAKTNIVDDIEERTKPC